MKKQGQLHISETVAVLFIFFILVMFGIIFYYQYQKVSINDKQEELLATRAMEITLKTLFLPELSCTRGNAEVEDNCFEVSKLEYAGTLFTQHTADYYFNIFSYSNISVHQVYPEEKVYKLYSKEKTKTLANGSIVPAWGKKEPTFFVLALKDARVEGEPRYGFGYLEVEVYS